MKYTVTNPPISCLLSKASATKMDIKGIIIHATNLNNSKLNLYIQPRNDAKNKQEILNLLGENTKWLGPLVANTVHARIGYTKDNNILSVQVMPWYNKGNRCGKGTLGSCNDGWIQIEICSDDMSHQDYFNYVYNELIELISYLCKAFNLNPRGDKVILDHAKAFSLGLANNESNISTWFNKFGKTLDNIIQDTAKNLGYSEISNTIKVCQKQVTTDLNIREKPTVASPVVGKLITGDIITINAIEGNWCKLQNGAGWVSNKYLSDTIVNLDIDKIAGTKKGLVGSTDAEKIWNYLFSVIGNEYGVAGLMGNIKAESALKSNNLQQTYERKLGFTDELYTAAVDNGTYTNFIHDKAGYGLVQWTYWSLKEELYKYAKQQKKSIGDLEMQLEFLCKQLSKSYSAVWNTLKLATNVMDASNAVLLKFERPADQSETMQKKRANYGLEYYNQFSQKIKNSTKIELEGTNLGSVLIGHASVDENGRSTGGVAGDQTGKELCIRSWYNKPWIKVFRPISNINAEAIASAMEAACENNHIGYNQFDRKSLYEEAKKVNFDLNKISNDCNTDGSALVAVCINAANIPVSAIMTTATEEKILSRTAAFQILTSSEYLTSSQYLKRGDILLAEGHTAIVLSNGQKIVEKIKTTQQEENNKYVGQAIGTAISLENMNVRTGAGAAYKVIDNLPKNSRVEVLSITTTGWLKIIWPKSTSGYAYVSNSGGKYFVYTPKAEAPTIMGTPVLEMFNIKVEADALNVRKQPDVNSPVQAIIKKGSIHTIIETLSNWGHLKSGGWISLVYTKRV